MAAARLVVELTIGEEDMAKLMAIARSRTETASRVERSRMLLADQDDPSFFAVGRALAAPNQTVRRCVERAVAFGPLAALDDRPGQAKRRRLRPRPRHGSCHGSCHGSRHGSRRWPAGKPRISAIRMSCGRRAFWPAMRANMGRRAGVIAFLAQGAVCKILGAQAIKPHKARCYLQRRDPECEVKMAQILCIYKEVEILKAAAGNTRITKYRAFLPR